MGNKSMLIDDPLLEINGVCVQVQGMCEKHVPIDSALEYGEKMLKQQIDKGLNLDTFVSDAQKYSDRVASYKLPDAVAHYWEKSGMESNLTQKSFEAIRNVLAIFSAWQNQKSDMTLGLPDKFDLVVWHGFILQTREYQEFCEILGKFIHHRTTEGGQGASCMLTLALYETAFGKIDSAVWGEIDKKHIIFGWCSVDD